MILSVSRRTDVPSYYGPWFLERLRAGEVLFPYPRHPGQVGRVVLSPEHIDCIVFWTKNPAPMLPLLDEMDDLGYRYCFSFTLTPYGRELELRLPPKPALVETFLTLSKRIGPERVDWRYDPLVVDDAHPPQWHLELFERYCGLLSGATQRCIVNFVVPYQHLRRKIPAPTPEQVKQIATGFTEIAARYNLPLGHCSSEWDLQEYGIPHSACIDSERIGRIVGAPMKVKKDPGQPDTCHCAASVDVGVYHSCWNGCAYCYANTHGKLVLEHLANHDPEAPMLSGYPTVFDTIVDRTGPSLVSSQLEL